MRPLERGPKARHTTQGSGHPRRTTISVMNERSGKTSRTHAKFFTPAKKIFTEGRHITVQVEQRIVFLVQVANNSAFVAGEIAHRLATDRCLAVVIDNHVMKRVDAQLIPLHRSGMGQG